MTTTSRVRGGLLALLVGAGLALVPALPAAAHVSVSSPDAAPGGFGKLVFRVPSESDTANTTSVSVELPADTPFRFVSAGVNPGWTAEATTTQLPEPVESDGFTLTEAVTRVTWMADGDGLPPHQFTEFQLSVGPFPVGVERLVLPATQTYSDGTVVEWSEVAAEGAPEPERPAPVLDLSGDADAAQDATADAAEADAGTDDDDGGTDAFARALATIGVALGAAGLAIALAGRRARRTDA